MNNLCKCNKNRETFFLIKTPLELVTASIPKTN